MKAIFFGTFFCQESRENGAAAKKNIVYFKLTKTRFTVLKINLYNLNFSLKLQRTFISFNTVKSVFVDFTINTIFLTVALFFPCF